MTETAREIADGLMERLPAGLILASGVGLVRDTIEAAVAAAERRAAEEKDAAYHERNQCVAALARIFRNALARLLRDVSRLSSALAAEQKRNERLAGALREAIGIASIYSAGRCSPEITARLAALSQEKQT